MFSKRVGEISSFHRNVMISLTSEQKKPSSQVLNFNSRFHRQNNNSKFVLQLLATQLLKVTKVQCKKVFKAYRLLEDWMIKQMAPSRASRAGPTFYMTCSRIRIKQLNTLSWTMAYKTPRLWTAPISTHSSKIVDTNSSKNLFPTSLSCLSDQRTLTLRLTPTRISLTLTLI